MPVKKISVRATSYDKLKCLALSNDLPLTKTVELILKKLEHLEKENALLRTENFKKQMRLIE